MNKRIRQLWKDAAVRDDSVHPWTYDPDLHVEKFAELIVRECAKSANDWYQNHDKIHSDPMSYVLAHFGVEE